MANLAEALQALGMPVGVVHQDHLRSLLPAGCGEPGVVPARQEEAPPLLNHLEEEEGLARPRLAHHQPIPFSAAQPFEIPFTPDRLQVAEGPACPRKGGERRGLSGDAEEPLGPARVPVEACGDVPAVEDLHQDVAQLPGPSLQVGPSLWRKGLGGRDHHLPTGVFGSTAGLETPREVVQHVLRGGDDQGIRLAPAVGDGPVHPGITAPVNACQGGVRVPQQVHHALLEGLRIEVPRQPLQDRPEVGVLLPGPWGAHRPPPPAVPKLRTSSSNSARRFRGRSALLRSYPRRVTRSSPSRARLIS